MSATTVPHSSPDNAPCKSYSQMFATCVRHGSTLHVYIDIQEKAYQLLESMKISVWLCENCEENKTNKCIYDAVYKRFAKSSGKESSIIQA